MSVPRHRKLSFPATLHPTLLGLPDRDSKEKRRFSTVVSRKLSSTIHHWRTPSVPTADIVAQGKLLCGQYIRCRLKRSNLWNKKCNLQRLRSAASLAVRQVFPELLSIGVELERVHSTLYTGVGRQASATPVLTTEKAVTGLLTSVAREMVKEGVTWAKVVSLYAVAGGLAADCVRQGHPEFLPTLVESMGEALHYHIAVWIAHNGGWAGLLNYCKPPDNEVSLAGFLAALVAAMLGFLLLFFLLRFFGRLAFL